MNVSNILKVADAIESHAFPTLGFNLARYYSTNQADLSGHHCGTTACIAGWAVCVVQGAVPRAYYGGSRDIASNFFEISEDTAELLFTPLERGFVISPYNATPVEAARVLRNLAITGKVDWAAAMKPDEPVLPPLPASRSLTRAITEA